MRVLALAFSAVVAFSTSQSPFVGTWKLNVSKSQFTGSTIAYEQLQSGEMQATAEGQSYKFRVDGKEYPASFGMTAAWKQVDPNTWEATYKLKDRVLGTETIKVSTDAKTLTVNSRGKAPDGSSFDNSTEYARVSGGPGLAGRWKSTKVSVSASESVEIGPYDGDGIAWSIPAYKASVNLKFDGKDYSAVGPTIPPGFTFAATMTGPRSFDLVEKENGKVVYRGTYTVSADGKTLTAVSAPEGTNEKIVAVYDRQ